MNVWDIVILLGVGILVGLAVFRMVKNRREGKSSCGCDCGSCSCTCGSRKTGRN